jgi:hypothetical protein
MKNYSIEIKWALLFSAMSLLWMVIEKAVGLHDQYLDQQQYLTNLFAIPAILLYVFALREKRSVVYGGQMSFKEGFISGLILTGIIAVLAPLVQYITSTYITPDYFANVIKRSVELKMFTQAEAEAQFNLKSYLLMSFVGALGMGVVTSAIVAFFLRKRH